MTKCEICHKKLGYLQPHVVNSKNHPSWQEYLRMFPATNKVEEHPFGNSSRSRKTKEKISRGMSGENNPNFGKSRPSFSKKISGKNHPLYGKKRSKETIQKIRKGVKKWLKENEHPRKGVSLLEKTRLKISEAHKGLQAGENHPNWKGGTYIRNQKEWKEIRKKARKRDNFTCRRCGIKERELGQKLDVHHIVPLNEGGRNDLSNLVTLCRSCHSLVEQNKEMEVPQ